MHGIKKQMNTARNKWKIILSVKIEIKNTITSKICVQENKHISVNHTCELLSRERHLFTTLS